jgi:hypothetical protein
MTKIFETAQTPKTPFIEFNSESGVFRLKGKSIPENAVLFYKPLFEWLDLYFQSPAPETALNIQLDYFNTSSAKILADLFKKLENFQNTNKGKVLINWQYNEEDDDMLEAGEDYKSICKATFNLLPFKNKTII